MSAEAITTTAHESTRTHNTILPAAGNIPQEIQELDQWVGWRYEKHPGKDKLKKAPINPRTGRNTDPTKPRSCSTFREAIQGVENYNLEGIGLALTEDDPYVAIDLDEAIDPNTRELKQWAAKIIESFNSYWEISPSGRGVRILVCGKLPGKGVHKKNPETEEGIGLFDRIHYVTVTGNTIVPGVEIKERQDQIEKFYEKVKPEEKVSATATLATSTPTIPIDIADQELLAKACSAANGEKFKRLYYRGDTRGYASHSEADLALCGTLAFWTGRDAERIDRLFRASALMRPEKWSRAGYRDKTLRRAIAGCKEVYSPNPRGATPKVQEILESLKQIAANFPWEGRGGPTDRYVYLELLNTGGGWGKDTERGIDVSVALRDLAPNAGVSARTANTSLERLQKRGLIEILVPGKGKRATRIIILKPSHIDFIPPPPTCVEYVKGRGAELLSKLRNPSPEMPEYDSKGRRIPSSGKHLLRPMGKPCALILERVVCHGSLSLTKMSEILERRADNLKRSVWVLIESGLLVEDRGVYRAHPDWEDRLQRELEESGCNEAERRDRRRYEKDRADYHNYSPPPAQGTLLDECPPMRAEKFEKLAATIREGISRMREEKPPLGRSKWGVDAKKEQFYFPERYATHNPVCSDI